MRNGNTVPVSTMQCDWRIVCRLRDVALVAMTVVCLLGRGDGGHLIAVEASVPATSLTQSIDAVQPRIVKLFGAGGLRNLAAYGTGFLVSPDGHIVTVWSHLLDADVVTVVLSDGRRFFGRVQEAAPDLGMALLKIDAEGLPFFDLKTATAGAGPGTRVLAFSNMFKVAAGDEPVSVQHGVVAAKTKLAARRGRFDVPYQGDVYIVDAVTGNPGSPGGVLTTWDGKLLGMLGRQVMNSETNTALNYAMPIEALRPVIQDMLQGKYRRRSLTADDDNPANAYRASDFGLVLVPNVVYRTPAYIDSVLSGSGAEEQGLRPNDLIVFANGELVHSIRSLNETLSRLQPGGDLTLIVRRGDELLTVVLRIPDRQ